jgi:hypothetical protein
VASLVGLGFLPCPECGAPMIIHFWPIAAVVALRNYFRGRQIKREKEESEDLSLNDNNY